MATGARACGWALLPADPMGATVRKITSRGRVAHRDPHPLHLRSEPAGLGGAGRRDRGRAAHDPSTRAFRTRRTCRSSTAGRGGFASASTTCRPSARSRRGSISACCENGLGTVKSTLAGMMAADLATGTRSDDPRRIPGSAGAEPASPGAARLARRQRGDPMAGIAGRPRGMSLRRAMMKTEPNARSFNENGNEDGSMRNEDFVESALRRAPWSV